MLLIICSSVPAEGLLKMAEKHFGKIMQGDQPTQIQENISVKDSVLYKQRDIKQVIFSFGSETFGINDPRHYQSKVAAHILSSVMFEKLREEQGLTYTANAFNRFYKETGAIYSIISTDKNKLTVTLKTTLACIEKLKGEIKETYFTKAKNVILSNLLFEEERPSVYSFNIAYQSLYKEGVESIEDKVKAINEVTKEDVFNLMNEYFVKGKVGYSFLGNIDNKTITEINTIL
jgi:predicted Zn-dependent peptidase